GMREIAARLGGVSEGAVRQRLYRATQRLRTSLDAESEEKGKAWLPAAVGISRIGSKAGAGLSGGAVLAVAATCGLLAAAAALHLVSPTRPLLVPAIESSEGLAGGPAMSAMEVPIVSPLDQVQREPLLPNRVGPVMREFRLVDPRDGAPIEGSDWALLATGAMDPEPFGAIDPEYLPPFPPLAVGVSGPNGEILLPPFDADIAQLLVSRSERHAMASFAVDGRVESTSIQLLRPPLGISFTGRVVDAEGRPLPGAEILELDTRERLRLATQTDQEGRFTLTGIAGLPRQLLRREDGQVVSTWRDASQFYMRSGPSGYLDFLTLNSPRARGTGGPPEGASYDLGDVELKAFVRVKGRVVDESGWPVAGAVVGSSEWFDTSEKSFSSVSAASKIWSAARFHRDFQTTDKDGCFEFRSVPRVFGGKRIAVLAMGPDGDTGRAFSDVQASGDRDELIVTLSPHGMARLRLRDRAYPDRPLELLKGVAREVTWTRVEGPLATRTGRSQTAKSARLLPSDTVALPGVRVRRGGELPWISLEVPGYEPALLQILRSAEPQVIDLDRRPRKRIEVRLVGENTLQEQTMTLILVSQPLKDRREFASRLASRRVAPSTGASGGSIHGVRSHDVVELAPPFGKPAWLVVLPDPKGPYRLATPTILGPFESLEDGAVLDIALEPWDASDRWGTRDLSKEAVLPRY
ncbi:MAG: hypothetical protein AAGG01_14700, partial [Planctomycetota bacterium]